MSSTINHTSHIYCLVPLYHMFYWCTYYGIQKASQYDSMVVNEPFYYTIYNDYSSFINLVSFPVAAVTLIIPCLIYKLFFRYNLDIEAYLFGWIIAFALYFLLVSIAFERRYERIPIDMIREKYKSSRLDRLVPDFAIILVPIVLCIGGILFAFYIKSEE